ncbi:hypothetical protein CLV62_13019 [Dysgonomonas alginatilytica]|uniref:Holin family protein n=1 Tax=Dysgonomonas alginatilytica TaxID=1605892 RepID=A0A2V3PLP5_9BACT|nr:hypothetical protein [Dysgonomonas alginatilytica]PXV60171.1 hypothetical protein CLV62_13019 [Dysgonomonas alginatilytica]
MDAIKLFLITLLSAIVAFFEPIKNPVIVLFLVFAGDFIFGIMVDLFVNDDRLRIKKGIFALMFLFLYMSVIVLTFLIGFLMGDLEESLFIVKALTYVFTAAYVANTLRNICLLFPNNRVFAFLYHIFGLQILKKMPLLYNYIFDKKDDNK